MMLDETLPVQDFRVLCGSGELIWCYATIEDGMRMIRPVEGVKDLFYLPSCSGQWADDGLFVSYRGQIKARTEDGMRFPAGWDFVIYGAQIVPFLLLSARRSAISVDALLAAIREKERAFLPDSRPSYPTLDQIIASVSSAEAP